MTGLDLPKHPDISQFAQHVERLRGRLVEMQREIPTEVFARRCGAKNLAETTETGAYELAVWNHPVVLLYPEWVVKDSINGTILPITTQALVLFYFITADGVQPDRNWISFGDLPDGRFYNRAYQGYTGAELARTFKNDLSNFEQSAIRLGGVLMEQSSQSPGDRAYIFQALPRLAILAAYWIGDEDFPASAQILFESTASHYLPTDVCAYLGSSLTRRMVGQN